MVATLTRMIIYSSIRIDRWKKKQIYVNPIEWLRLFASIFHLIYSDTGIDNHTRQRCNH